MPQKFYIVTKREINELISPKVKAELNLKIPDLQSTIVVRKAGRASKIFIKHINEDEDAKIAWLAIKEKHAEDIINSFELKTNPLMNSILDLVYTKMLQFNVRSSIWNPNELELTKKGRDPPKIRNPLKPLLDTLLLMGKTPHFPKLNKISRAANE